MATNVKITVLCGVTPHSFDRRLPNFQGKQLPQYSSRRIYLRWVEWKSWTLTQSIKLKRSRNIFRNFLKTVNGAMLCLSLNVFYHTRCWHLAILGTCALSDFK
jgi:hypothetical protein